MPDENSVVYYIFIKFENDRYGIERKEEWIPESWCPVGVWSSLRYACEQHKVGGYGASRYNSGPIKLMRYEKYPEWPNMRDFENEKDCRERFMTEEKILTQEDMAAYVRESAK